MYIHYSSTCIFPDFVAPDTVRLKKLRLTGANAVWTSLKSLESQAKAPMGRCTRQRTKTLVSVMKGAHQQLEAVCMNTSVIFFFSPGPNGIV